MRRLLLAVLLLGLVALAGCGAGGMAGPSQAELAGGSLARDYNLQGVRVTVGSKEFTENVILGKMLIQALRAAGAEVVDRTKLQGSNIVRAALVSKQIDLYWDYAGTGWSLYLKHTDVIPDEIAQFRATATEDLARNQVHWAGPAAFGDEYAITRRGNATGRLAEVNTLSDLARFAHEQPSEATFCGASEFLDREFEKMQRAYGFAFAPSATTQNALALCYVNVSKGSPCNFAEATTTDARLKNLGLRVLRDDRNFFLSQRAAVLMREETFRARPELARLATDLGAKLTEPVMIDLNAQVDLDGQSPDAVAAQFLRANGFIGRQ